MNSTIDWIATAASILPNVLTSIEAHPWASILVAACVVACHAIRNPRS
jgi:hypothetical protein